MPSKTDVTLTSAPDIAASLPHLLGFHPRESLICLWIADGALQATQRADLPAPSDDVDAADYVDAFFGAARNVPATDVIAVCLTEEPDMARSVLELVRDRVDARCRGLLFLRGSQVCDLLRDGSPWEWVSAHHREVAKRTLGAGTTMQPARTRERVEHECQPDASLVDSCGPLPHDATHAVRQVLQLICEQIGLHPAPQGLTGIDTRTLRDAISTVEGRDAVMGWAAVISASQRRDLLREVMAALRGTPASGTSGAANVAATVCAIAWLCGDGVRANAALDRCLADDPDLYMGHLLAGIIAAGIPPDQVAEALVQSGPEQVLAGIDPAEEKAS